jgi:hypothetical protein
MNGFMIAGLIFMLLALGGGIGFFIWQKKRRG